QPTSAAAYGLRQGEEGRPVVRRQPARQYRAAQGAEARLPHALSRADGEDACRGSRGLASSTTCATPSQTSCSAAEWTRTSLARQPLEMAAAPFGTCKSWMFQIVVRIRRVLATCGSLPCRTMRSRPARGRARHRPRREAGGGRGGDGDAALLLLLH